MSSKDKVLITGASTGIGALYADRFAKRGHDLVLVARDGAKLAALADRLSRETGVTVEVLAANLTNAIERGKVEDKLASDETIAILVNNAGTILPGEFLDQAPDDVERLIALNVTAPTRLAAVVAPRLAAQGHGAIINISSILGLTPEFGYAVYGATKAFVTFFSQSLNKTLGDKGVYVQAVLPAATRTEIWDKGGVDVNTVPGVMAVEDLVDAALAGFDRHEAVTIPPLQNESEWLSYDAARKAMLGSFQQSKPAARYTSTK
jgi:short-subunit dehydrogenase